MTRNRNKIVQIVILLVVITPLMTHGREGGLYIGKVFVKLGMSEKAVLASLRKEHNVLEVGGGNYMIAGSSGDDYLGAVAFRDGKLVYANKSLRSFTDRGAFELVEHVTSLLEYLAQEGDRSGVVTFSTHLLAPTAKTKTIELCYRSRIIQLELQDCPEGNVKAVVIRELIR